MTFLNSPFSSQFQYSKIEFSFGTYFFLDHFIISELNDGIHFNWEKVQEVIDAIISHYGENAKIGYISNRVHSYSIEPQLWIDFFKKHNFVAAISIVAYNDINFKNAALEKHFSKVSLEGYPTLKEAINWMLQFKEFN